MKLKQLVLTFSYNQIKEKWYKKDYRLPTLEEAKLIDTDHKLIWIQSDENEDIDRLLYNRETGNIIKVNKNNKYNAILIKDVDVVIEWSVSSKKQNHNFKCDSRDEALEFIEANKSVDNTLRLVKTTKEYYR